MPQTDDSTQDYRSKISYPQLSGNVSGSVSNSGMTVAPTPPATPAPSAPTSGSIPSSFSQPQLMAPAGGGGSSGGSGSGGGGGAIEAPAAAKPELTVNLQQRPMLGTEAQPGAVQPAPLGVRAAQSVKSAAGPVMDALSTASDIASIPGKIVGKAADAAGTVASDFGKEMLNLGGSQILPPGSPAAQAQAAAAAKNPNAVDADSPAPGQRPPLKQPAAAQPVPALLGGNGIMDKPLAAPGALMTPSQGGAQQPAGIQAPTLQPLGPVPKLEAKDNQSIFEAMVNLGGDISKYKSGQAGNAMVQQNFKNMLEASKYNIENLSKMTEVQSKFSDDQRKNFDTQLKARTAEAVRQLSLGPKSAANPNGYEPNQMTGLRLLANIEKTPDNWKPHEVLIPRLPGQEMFPQEKVTVFENTKTGAIMPFNAGTLQQNTVTRSQADQMKTQGKMSDAQLVDYLKKHGKTIAGN